MSRAGSPKRWIVVIILFIFLLFHQADKTIISPLLTPIMAEFNINEAQMGAVSSLGIIVSSLLYPVWGYLYDRFSRPKLLSLASLIWGSTTALSAIAPSFRLFMITRASTGIDDSSYPGLYSLLSDYFRPSLRGKIYGLMQISGPFGYMTGIVLASTLGMVIGWRNIFIITGVVGVIMAFVIFFGVGERSRGVSEPEMIPLDDIREYRITWQEIKELRNNRSLLYLVGHGFVGVFTWNVLTFWLFHYLEVERGFSALGAMGTMLLANAALILGYLIGGNLGDKLFLLNPRGRMILAGLGTFLGGMTLVISFLIPFADPLLFLTLLALTGFFLAFVSPNLMATVHDITLPEVRSSAQALRQLFMDSGAAAAPFLAGLIAVHTSLHTAILSISITAWILGTCLVTLIALFVPQDIEKLRETMAERAERIVGAENNSEDLLSLND